MQRNLPNDLDLLPELYKQFNILANAWLIENYAECEHNNTNSQDFRCYLMLYSNAATGKSSVVFYIGDENYSYDSISDALNFLESVTT